MAASAEEQGFTMDAVRTLIDEASTTLHARIATHEQETVLLKASKEEQQKINGKLVTETKELREQLEKKTQKEETLYKAEAEYKRDAEKKEKERETERTKEKETQQFIKQTEENLAIQIAMLENAEKEGT